MNSEMLMIVKSKPCLIPKNVIVVIEIMMVLT